MLAVKASGSKANAIDREALYSNVAEVPALVTEAVEMMIPNVADADGMVKLTVISLWLPWLPHPSLMDIVEPRGTSTACAEYMLMK
jgi:hypothetical protein